MEKSDFKVVEVVEKPYNSANLAENALCRMFDTCEIEFDVWCNSYIAEVEGRFYIVLFKKELAQ